MKYVAPGNFLSRSMTALYENLVERYNIENKFYNVFHECIHYHVRYRVILL